MFLRITYLDDIERVAAILVKNGYTVKRASVPGKNKKKIHGIEILDSTEAPKEDDDE
jgi:hypothetical protein